MRRLTTASACAAAALGLVGAIRPPHQAPPEPAAGLERLWARGAMLRDANGDGFVDTIRWAIELADGATATELAAAANIAARVGYETMALDLPVPSTTDSGVVFRIGSPRQTITELELLGAGGGAPAEHGQVVITPDPAGPTRVIVTGADAVGLSRAALLVAGRLPYLSTTSGPTLEDTSRYIQGELAALGFDAPAVAVRGISLSESAARVTKLLVRAPVADAAAVAARLADGGPEVDRLVPGAADELLLWLQEEPPVIVSLVGSGPPESNGDEATDGARPGAGGREKLTLSALYDAGGLLGDRNDDLIADRTDVVLVPGDGVGRELLDLAARLGLESAGVVLPIAKPAAAVEDPDEEPTLVLLGTENPLVRRLVQEERLSLAPMAAGEGSVRVVRDAFGDKSAIVVAGDARGLAAAISGMAETWPHLGARGKDRPVISTVEEDLRRFAAQRSPAGQAAAAMYKADQLLDEAPPDALDIELHVAVEGADPQLAQVITGRLGSDAGRVSVRVEDLAVGAATQLFDETVTTPGEVATLIDLVSSEVVPRVADGEPVSVEARISEPRAVRERTARRIRDLLAAAGATDVTVTVLPAYKQGLGWLEEVIAPRLRVTEVERVRIRFAEAVPPAEWEIQALNTPTRWLLELFPIDELLAADLGLELDDIVFEMAPPGGPIYEVVATARGGDEILRERFDPRFVVQPYFALFPRYEQVRVTTGWVTGRIGTEMVADQRLETDLEQVWRHYQEVVLPRLHDYVMRLHDGKPRRDRAPHFGELRVEVELSEPERPLGIDMERIAPLEALHEELYFGTLHFFDLVGRMASGAPLDYPGRVIPVVRPRADGRGGSARFVFSGFSAPGPRVEIAWRDAAGRRHTRRRDLWPVAVAEPEVHGALYRADGRGLARLDLVMQVDAEIDERAALVARTAARRVDSRWMSGAQLEAALRNLAALRAAGAYRDELAYEGHPILRLHWSTQHDPTLEATARVDLEPNGMPPTPPDAGALVGGANAPGTRVQWETPIPPDEAHAVIATMGAEFEHATTYRVGVSYLGREIWAMDLMAPLSGTHWSQGKATALKPTVVYSARQHANEVSSTSHVLRLAERLLTEPAGHETLQRVNVIIHPITNPDGAQLAYDLHGITPDHMLHAGYLGSLGVDVTAGSGEDDPVYPEANVRERLWRTWRPDIFLNPHGYPSHEWVQPFSEYAAWVRQRVTEQRGWWGMRGWFMPGFGYLDDPEYPRHKEAAFAIREHITRAISSLPAIVDLNRRAYDRYRRYGPEFDPETFKMDLTDGVLIYTALKGARAGGDGFMSRNPKVTIWTGSTEAPDETAHGDWLRLVASAGLAWDEAILDYLLAVEHAVEYRHEGHRGGFDLHLHRERPGRFPENEPES